jgi:hypothetical protein
MIASGGSREASGGSRLGGWIRRTFARRSADSGVPGEAE